MSALNIKDEEVRALAKQLAQATHQTMTEAVRTALQEKLARHQAADQAHLKRKLAAIQEITRRLAELPLLDTRSEDEILGYNEFGGFE